MQRNLRSQTPNRAAHADRARSIDALLSFAVARRWPRTLESIFVSQQVDKPVCQGTKATVLIAGGAWFVNRGNGQRAHFQTTGPPSWSLVVILGGGAVWCCELATLQYQLLWLPRPQVRKLRAGSLIWTRSGGALPAPEMVVAAEAVL